MVFLTLFAFLDLDGKPEFSPELTNNLLPDEPSKLEHEHELELELEHKLDLELKLELELAELASKLFNRKQIHRLFFRNHKCIILAHYSPYLIDMDSNVENKFFGTDLKNEGTYVQVTVVCILVRIQPF